MVAHLTMVFLLPSSIHGRLSCAGRLNCFEQGHLASEPRKHEERPPWCHDREHCHTRVVISNHGGTVFLHPFIGLVCVWVGRGCLASVLGMTFKLLQARYRPMPVLGTVSLNFLPKKVKDISAPSSPVPQCIRTGGVPRPIWPVLMLWGFAGFHGRLFRDMTSP